MTRASPPFKRILLNLLQVPLKTTSFTQIHSLLFTSGASQELSVLLKLAEFLASSQTPSSAYFTLKQTQRLPNPFLFNTLISSYTQSSSPHLAFAVFKHMVSDGSTPDKYTFPLVLKSCVRFWGFEEARQIHGVVAKLGFLTDLYVQNVLIHVYGLCGCYPDACIMFDDMLVRDVVSWTCLISVCVKGGRFVDALTLFAQMDVAPNITTIVSVLVASGRTGELNIGRSVHGLLLKNEAVLGLIAGNALLDMYVKCERIDEAKRMFKELPMKDIVTWTSIISGYAKCGCLDMALEIFENMPIKNIRSWNALIGGLAMHGHGKEALGYFEWMVRTGLKPNDVSFIAILSACSHSGLVEEGRRHFASMIKFHDLVPKIEHYGCMVDLLGRAGLVEEAYELVKTMPMKADVLIWGAMLSACRTSGKTEISQWVRDSLLELGPSDSGAFVLLSNIYATNDRWGDISRLRRLMRKKGIKKEPGSSIIELDGWVHEFLVGVMEHHQMEDILMVLYIFEKQMQIDEQ
ncbi:Pentatricopeptide repeat-containing protein [Platanthera zijinensis]|uniref:Pentatricopeptide repeat-containing protein n=1 Tax=Platanthera zijinensis TaxID=2320716 RepID=A0AAP0BDS1_9ASPA